MPQLNFQWEGPETDWKRQAKRIEDIIFGAAYAAIKDVAKQVQSQARAEIAGAGFTGKWVTGFRTYIFPKTPSPGDELVVRGFHAYNIANVYERGAKVTGKPYLWVPLSTAPKSVKGKATTPARLIAAGVRLHRINEGGHPLLVGSVLRSAPRAKRKAVVGLKGGKLLIRSGQVTVQMLLNGQRNIRRTQARRAFGGRGPQSVSIPLFVGLTSVQLKKRFNVSAVYQRAREDLPKYYHRHVAELDRK